MVREWLAKLALVGFGFFIVLVTLVALEFYLSKFAPHIQTWPRGFHERDKYIGYKGIPGYEKKWVKGRIESYVKMNSHGFRDRERTYEKEKGAFRILVLGDSMTAGLEVPFEKTFPYLLEEKLNSEGSKGSKRIEVINLGVSGFSTAQEYLTLKHYGLKYHPDLVILAYFNNDVRGNSLILQSKYSGKSINNRTKPFFVLNSGKLEELSFSDPDKEKEETKNGTTGQFQIKYLMFKGVKKFLPNIYYSLVERINEIPWLASILWKIGLEKYNPKPSETTKNDIFIDDYVFSEEYSPEWENAWEVTKALILRISEELKENKIGFLVVIIPSEYELRPDFWDEYLKNYPSVTLEFDLEKPERILSDFLRSNNIDYLLLSPEFKEYTNNTGERLHWHYKYDGHWNANGHALAAQLIYKKLLDDNLVPHAKVGSKRIY
jgi:hypothetical protein